MRKFDLSNLKKMAESTFIKVCQSLLGGNNSYGFKGICPVIFLYGRDSDILGNVECGQIFYRDLKREFRRRFSGVVVQVFRVRNRRKPEQPYFQVTIRDPGARCRKVFRTLRELRIFTKGFRAGVVFDSRGYDRLKGH